jgi:hypothetical protein
MPLKELFPMSDTFNSLEPEFYASYTQLGLLMATITLHVLSGAQRTPPFSKLVCPESKPELQFTSLKGPNPEQNILVR